MIRDDWNVECTACKMVVTGYIVDFRREMGTFYTMVKEIAKLCGKGQLMEVYSCIDRGSAWL